MRYSASSKFEIIKEVEESSFGVKRTLEHLGISRSTFYRWYDRYIEGGLDALEDIKPCPTFVWNRVPDEKRKELVDLALDEPALSPRELAVKFSDDNGYFISESTAYRILKENNLIASPAWIVMKASDKFREPTTAINQLWQTDFTYFKIIGWGWYYLSTIMDDYSRYIITWRLCTSMKAKDVEDTLEDALRVAGLDKSSRPRLLSDNGPCYVSSELKSWLDANDIAHTRGKPYHPMTQGKIERWHRTMKDRILLDNYYYPEDLEREINKFVNNYNQRRYHESLNNLTPEDVWLKRGENILEARRKIKKKTMKLRKMLYLKQKAA